MCYSAMMWDEYGKYVRAFGADISIGEYVQIYWTRLQGGKVRTPKGMDAAFLADPRSDDERRIAQWIVEHERLETARLQTGLFAQRKRLADAERKLQAKATKAAQEDRRIAGNKVEQLLGRLADLGRREPRARDARFYPGWHTHVMVSEGGRRVLKPMRYRCRMPGWSDEVERRFPGTYMARRDKLEVSWSKLFGHTHGLIVMTRFYENVERRDADGAPVNVELEFAPRATEPMLVACLWSRTPTADGDLLSFAAISDDPPEEILAAGHDRCPIPIRAEYIDAWLDPDPCDLRAQHAILDDRERPYYEHRLAEAA
jgi:putative SOS response-associated peptidase YedK